MASARETTGQRLREQLRLYVLTDRDLSRGRSDREIVEAAIAGGATAIQLRWKTGTLSEALEVGRELREICSRAGVLFIVNDRVDLALALNADGVHLGEHDLPPREARRIAGDRLLIGYSPPTLTEAIQAERMGVDYLGVGPVFVTSTKADAGLPVGTDRIREVTRLVSIPVVGVGGISSSNAPDVIMAGADGVAVISSVVAADDVRDATYRLRAGIDVALAQRDGQ